MLIAMMLTTATPLYLAPLVDRFTGEACPLPTRGKVDDGTIEYSVDVLLNTNPSIMGRCHARRLAAYEVTHRRHPASR